MAFRKIQITNLVSTETAFSDNIILTGKDNISPTDVGFLGKIGTDKFAGLIYDSATQEFLLIAEVTATNTTNDIDANNVTTGTLSVDTLKATTVDSPGVVKYYESATAPTLADSGSFWKDTDTDILYIASTANNITTWFEV